MTIGCSVKKSTALRLERSWVQLARSSLKKFWCIGSSATALNKSVHKTTYDYINILQEVYIPVLMWLKFMKIWGWKNHGKVIVHTFFFRRKQFSIESNSPTFFFGKRHQKFQNNSWSLAICKARLRWRRTFARRHEDLCLVEDWKLRGAVFASFWWICFGRV